MNAIIFTKYGPPEVLQLIEIAKPIPKATEVLVKIVATTVTKGDCEIRGFDIPFMLWLPVRLFIGIRKPRGNMILGQELSGEIEAVGKDVQHFRKGDPVFGTSGFSFGTNAEYICLPSSAVIATKPANMTYEEAAVVPVASLEALYFLQKAAIQRGQQVLINGAGGSIGTFAVQIAKHFGAEVTGVDSTGKLDMLRSIGCDHVIDYTRHDFTKNGKTYDVIFDVVGKTPFARSLQSLKPNGRYLLANAGLLQTARGKWASMTGRKKVIMGAASQTTEDLVFLKTLIEAGTIKSVIDKCYPLEQIAEAHRYVETGLKKGNVVITVQRPTT